MPANTHNIKQQLQHTVYREKREKNPFYGEKRQQQLRNYMNLYKICKWVFSFSPFWIVRAKEQNKNWNIHIPSERNQHSENII